VLGLIDNIIRGEGVLGWGVGIVLLPLPNP
jgi:hypothetical protein